MDNFHFYTSNDLEDKPYLFNLIKTDKWKKVKIKHTMFNRYEYKYRKVDSLYGITHLLYTPFCDLDPINHSFHISSINQLLDLGNNIYLPDSDGIKELEKLIIYSMLNVGLKFQGEIELSGFDVDVNVKFKDELEFNLVKEALKNIPISNVCRRKRIFDSEKEFGVEFRSKAKKLGFSIYDKYLRERIEGIGEFNEVQNCLRWAFRINGKNAMKNIFGFDTIPLDTLMLFIVNNKIIEIFSKRLKEIGIFKNSKIATRPHIKKMIKKTSHRTKGGYRQLADLRKLMKYSNSIPSYRKSRLKKKCELNNLCFTWVEDDHNREIFLYDMVMKELKLMLDGNSEFTRVVRSFKSISIDDSLWIKESALAYKKYKLLKP